jgi:hypothetical protein
VTAGQVHVASYPSRPVADIANIMEHEGRSHTTSAKRK